MAGRHPPVSLVADVEVRLGRFHEDLHLDVADGEVVAVLGPNGSGKTTLLRSLAGVVPLTGGRVVLDGQVLDDPAEGVLVPPERRPCGLVFQEHLLFPHLDVLANVAFGPRRRGASRSEATTVARDWLDRLGVAGCAHQRPDRLSGGQSQRVALARALATRPRLLLLDEPMAALDVTQRTVVRQLLRDRVGGSGASCVLVTHDPLDATALADSLVLIDDGRMVQRGTAREVARRPASPWVARLLGVNLLMGQVRAGWYDLGAGLGIPVPTAADGEWWAVLAPRDVAVTVYGAAGAGRHRRCRCDTDGVDHPGHDRAADGGPCGPGPRVPGRPYGGRPRRQPWRHPVERGDAGPASVIPTAVELFEPSSM